MIIATSITSDYFVKSMPFFDSVNRHFKGERICFCIGFHAELEGWKMVYVDPEGIQCKWKPKNRKGYISLQHGEFYRFYRFNDDDQVLFIDSDMILQREFKTDLVFKDKFLVTRSSFPPTTLDEVGKNVGYVGVNNCIRNWTQNQGVNGTDEEFCAALMIASVKEWKKLFHQIRIVYKEFLKDFTHHAAWQLLINICVIKNHEYQVLPPLIQNAEWYSGTEAKVVDDVLMWKDEVVYFNHTKFNRNFKY